MSPTNNGQVEVVEQRRLADVAPELAELLARARAAPPAEEAAIDPSTVRVEMRDGVRLATDVYRPGDPPAPAIAMRTPYGRARHLETFVALVRRGYAVVSQDCRGTGDSEPDHWDYYMYEREDSLDFVDWIAAQEWFGGFLGAVGGSYAGETQWCMAMHPAMSAIAPEVAGLGVVPTTRPRFFMFMNAYSRSVGKGADKVSLAKERLEREMLGETLAGGYFAEPLHVPLRQELLERFPDLEPMPSAEARRRLWQRYAALPPAERADVVKRALGEDNVTTTSVEALTAVFGHATTHDAHILPRARHHELAEALHAPPLMITGWYDWCLDDALATWQAMAAHAAPAVRGRARLLITPSAHNAPGYHEGREGHSELRRIYRNEQIVDVLLRWYDAVREDALESWPAVVYYLMGANEWRAADAWPPPGVEPLDLYLAEDGSLTPDAPPATSARDRYTYDPADPTPTVGGSIVSHVYTPGSVDVGELQRRPDVVAYTTDVLERDVDVVGPLRLTLYASSTAVDTDFCARLSDVFPDGRAIQLQTGALRTRYRDPEGDPEPLEPGRVHRFEIDMSATANRFRAGHRIRLDVSSADFPKFDRHANGDGRSGAPRPADQAIHRGADHPSRLRLHVA